MVQNVLVVLTVKEREKVKDIEEAIKLLVDSGFSVTSPDDRFIYLVDRGHKQTMSTRKTLEPKKNQFSKISAHRVALIRLDDLEWIDFPDVDYRKDNNNV